MKVLLLALAVTSCYAIREAPHVRQEFTENANDLITSQITKELQASYLYHAYANYFGRSDVALPGFKKFFSAASKEERDHAEQLMDYLNSRGGNVELADVKLRDVCRVISNSLSTITTERDTACICYFMTRQWDNNKGNCNDDRTHWKSGLWAMEDALILERYVNAEILSLHRNTDSDPHLSHILEHEFLDEQVKSIKEFGDYIRQLKRAGDGLGEYYFDQKLQ